MRLPTTCATTGWLDFLGAVDADPTLWPMDGHSLLGKSGVQQLRASTAPDAPKTIRLDWKLAADAAPPAELRVYRDNKPGKALVIDPKVNSYVMPIDWTGRARFPLGFWFNSDAKQAWLPVVTNKNWASGANPGFIVSQTDSPNALTFNFGDGKQRADAKLPIPSDQWVYIAQSVDTVAKKASAYVGNPGQKLQSAALDLAALDMAKALPAGPLVFNENATGKFYSGYAIGKVAPKYNDVAGRVEPAVDRQGNRHAPQHRQVADDVEPLTLRTAPSATAAPSCISPASTQSSSGSSRSPESA